MKRVGNLWEIVISDENLLQSIREVNHNHHWHRQHRPNTCTAWVEETLPERREELREILENGFVPNAPRIVRRYDASAMKWREISEPRQWPDQYVHHALIRALQPVMMRGMDRFCSGSIRGRGTHYAERAIARWMKSDVKGTKYCMQLDIRHFYDSLKPSVVMDRMRQLVKDWRVLDLIERATQNGILIGAYTSQWFANTVLQPLDHLIREGGYRVSHYIRYMDNFTVFGPNKRKLRQLREKIIQWLHARGLELKADWQLFRTDARLPSAVGYRFGRGYILPRKRNLLRMKRGIARFRKRKRKHMQITYKMAAGLLSRLAMLRHCNSVHIYRILYKRHRLVKELKTIVSLYSKGGLITWSMYMAQRAMSKPCEPKATPTLT